MKILNLDEIESKVDKTLIFKGKTHHFKPFTVGEYIDQLKELEELQASPDKISMGDYINRMVETVTRAFPTLPREELLELEPEKIRMIADHINGTLTEEVIKGVEADPEAAAASKN